MLLLLHPNNIVRPSVCYRQRAPFLPYFNRWNAHQQLFVITARLVSFFLTSFWCSTESHNASELLSSFLLLCVISFLLFFHKESPPSYIERKHSRSPWMEKCSPPFLVLLLACRRVIIISDVRSHTHIPLEPVSQNSPYTRRWASSERLTNYNTHRSFWFSYNSSTQTWNKSPAYHTLYNWCSSLDVFYIII